MQSSANLKQYYATCFSLIAGIIIFGGLLAPIVSCYILVWNYYFWFYVPSLSISLSLGKEKHGLG